MKEEPQTNAFLAILQQKERAGGLLTEASEVICQAAAAAQRTQKKATVTLTIEIQPKLNALNMKSDLKAKLPPEEQKLCIFYVDEGGQISRNDPSQSEFRFKQYEGGAGRPEMHFGADHAATGTGGSA